MSIAQDSVLAGDRERTIASMVIARAWHDPAYRNHFLREPKAVLADEGVEIPAGIDVRVLEETPTVRYISLAPETSDAEQVISTLRREIPLDEGRELRLVRSTEQTRYMVLPMPPAGPEKLSTYELNRRAAQDGVVAVSLAVAVNAEAEASATTTTDLAEAEAVIVVVLL